MRESEGGTVHTRSVVVLDHDTYIFLLVSILFIPCRNVVSKWQGSSKPQAASCRLAGNHKVSIIPIIPIIPITTTIISIRYAVPPHYTN